MSDRQTRLQALARLLDRRGLESAGDSGAMPLERQGVLEAVNESQERLLEVPGVDVGAIRRVRDLADVERRLRDGAPVSPVEQVAYEAIVLPKERPVFRVQEEDVVPFAQTDLNLLPPDVRAQLSKGPARFSPWLRSVCRVNLSNRGTVPYVGTAFVVGEDLLLTNRHVAQLFANGEGDAVQVVDAFKPRTAFGHWKHRREFDHNVSEEQLAGAVAPIVAIEWIHPTWDAALLRVGTLPGQDKHPLEGRPPLRLRAERLTNEEFQSRPIAVLGYPAFAATGDPTYEDVQRLVFENVFQVKRFQPGRAVGYVTRSFGTPTQLEVLQHDASTLGGNSGSAVVDLETGEVLGLHFSGISYTANYAVPASALAADPLVRRARINFFGTVPPVASGGGAPAQQVTVQREAVVIPDLSRVGGDVLAEMSRADGLSEAMRTAVEQAMVDGPVDAASVTSSEEEAPSGPPPAVIVYLPGIMGSHLADADSGERYWLDPLALLFGRFADHLTMHGGRVDPTRRVRANGLVNWAYGKAMRRWRALGLEVVPHAYDWRLPFQTLADELQEHLESVHARWPETPVWIVAHSMGGVVAATWAARHERGLQRITGAVTIGSPLAGAYTPVEVLRGTYGLLSTLSGVSFRHRKEDLQRMAATFPGMLSMLPDPRVFPAAPGEVETVRLYESNIWRVHAPEQEILDAALRLKDVLHTTPLHGKQHAILCDGFPTVAAVEPGVGGIPEPVIAEAGDGTVPARSSAPLDIKDRVYRADGYRHGDLLNHPGVIAAVVELVRHGTVTVLPRWQRPADPLARLPVPAEEAVAEASVESPAERAALFRQRAQDGTIGEDDLRWLYEPGTHVHVGADCGCDAEVASADEGMVVLPEGVVLESLGAVELSGPEWVSRYPTDRTTATLVQPFRRNVQRFITALEAAGVQVKINATLRPPQRAYLMRYAWEIAAGTIAPSAVPPMGGVAISWVHPSAAASLSAAKQMVNAYGLAFRPSLKSRHMEGRAIDMTISWTGRVQVIDGTGSEVTLDAARGQSSNPTLHALGRSFGVIKLLSDPPHWSDDGH